MKGEKERAGEEGDWGETGKRKKRRRIGRREGRREEGDVEDDGGER